jgi:hypothetical protein
LRKRGRRLRDVGVAPASAAVAAASTSICSARCDIAEQKSIPPMLLRIRAVESVSPLRW